MRVVTRVLGGAAIGAVFGAVTSFVNNVPGLLGEVGQAHSEDTAATWLAIFVSVILDSGWAWAALAFAIGWPARTPLIGAAAGTAGLVLATATYYLTDVLFDIEMYRRTVGYWLVRAVLFGLPLGAAGALARRPGRVGLLAALIVPAGAAANLILFPIWTGVDGESPAHAWATAAVWLAAAATTVLVVLRHRRHSSPTDQELPTPSAGG
jgi:Family of unknown function (DUF6518)